MFGHVHVDVCVCVCHVSISQAFIKRHRATVYALIPPMVKNLSPPPPSSSSQKNYAKIAAMAQVR